MTEQCKLCTENPIESYHHVIPKVVVKKCNPNSPLKDWTVGLCRHCHREIHYGFLIHLIYNKNQDGYNRLNALKYILLREYLINKHLPIWKRFDKWIRVHINNLLEEFGEDNKAK